MKVIKTMLMAAVVIWSTAVCAETKHAEGTLTVTATVVAPEPVVTVAQDGNVQIANPEYFYGTVTEEIKDGIRIITINY